MIEHIPLALSSLKTVLSISKTLADINKTANIQEQIIEFNQAIISAQTHILSAQEEQLRMSSDISELKKECMRLKDWSIERQKYSRREVATGVFAYIETDFKGKIENTHKYCCNCFDKTIQSTLQQGQIKTYKRKDLLVCPNGCPALEIPFGYLDSN